MRSALDKHKCKAAQEIAGAFNVAWTAAVIDAMDWPDTDLPVRYVKGFDVVFNIPDSGVFRKEPQPAEISRKEFMENYEHNNPNFRRFLSRLQTRLPSATSALRRETHLYRAWLR